MKRLIKSLAVVGAGVMLVFMLAGAADSCSSATSQTQTGTGQDRAGSVTLSMFNQIKTGMTLSEVRAITGMQGEQQSEVTIMGTTSADYAWANNDGSNMIIGFTDGKVDSKAQMGLR